MINNNKFITSILPWDGGTMVELNNLGKALMIQPEKFGDKMSQLFSSQNYYSDNPISSIALKNGAKKIVTSNEWEWKLSTSNTAPTTVVEDLEKTNDKPGLGRTTFKIKLRDNWFKSTDVITPGTADQKYQCRIMEEPQRHGTNGWVYTVRIVSDDFSTFLPKMFLKAGTKWAKLYSTAGEADIKGGSTQFSAPITLKNSLGKLRKEYHVTDYALEQVLAVKLPTQTGKLADFWINYAEVEYWKQWYREIERAYWYNRKAKSIQTDAGRPVDSFAGIFEQLESANNHYYTDLTAELIENFMMDIFYARVKPGKGRSMKVFTGEYGMLIFSRAMQDLMEKREWKPIEGFNFEEILFEEYNHIAKVTINRPRYRNAFTPKTVWEMSQAFNYCREALDIRVVILTGAGDKAFCSGGDMNVKGHGGYIGTDGVPRLNVLDLQMQIRRLPKPVIAMVNGYAIGGGHVLHVVCDLSIASENAIFGQTGPKVGSFDAGFGASYLARVVGQKKAREIWFLCRQYSAEEAERMGLVNKVVPYDRLEDECIEWAETMIERSPLALRMMKAGFNAELDGQAGIQELAGDATMLYYTLDEAQEGGKAFLEKRKPDFDKYPQFP